MASPILFAGPSLFGVDPGLTAGYDVRPPAKRGDIEALCSSHHEPGVAIVADGFFRRHPAVGHRELRDALRASWSVWGVSSMGAIRALEMRDFGMRGFGRVFHALSSNPDITDDEVAILHSASAPYRPYSEPLINLRLFLDDKMRTGSTGESEAAALLASMKALYFGDRTVARLRSVLQAQGACPVDEFMREYSIHQAKRRDLIELLELTPWD